MGRLPRPNVASTTSRLVFAARYRYRAAHSCFLCVFGVWLATSRGHLPRPFEYVPGGLLAPFPPILHNPSISGMYRSMNIAPGLRDLRRQGSEPPHSSKFYLPIFKHNHLTNA